MGRYCSEKLTKLILISMESNIKYFSDSDLQPFTILATHFYKYDLLSPSFMQTQFKNRLFVLWPRVTSNILYLPEFFQTKQPANEHVRSEISLAALLGASLGSRLREKHPAQQAIVIRQTWRSPQRNLRGLHLWVCFSKKKRKKKASEESGPACSTSPLTDSTFQGSHAAAHAQWSSLTRLTFPGPHGWLTAPCPAEKATQCYAEAVPSLPRPTSPPLTTISRAGKVNASDSHSIWEALNCKTRVWPLNLAVIYDW